MTPEAQQIAIAEALGWEIVTKMMGVNTSLIFGIKPGSGPLDAMRPIPNYLNDLNAMHEAEKILNPSQRVDYLHTLGLDVLKLYPLAGDYWMAQELDCWAMLSATAAQRAEAFLKTLGLWTEEKSL
jgi:hypothetical protein